jgi:hypothetical protein
MLEIGRWRKKRGGKEKWTGETLGRAAWERGCAKREKERERRGFQFSLLFVFSNSFSNF